MSEMLYPLSTGALSNAHKQLTPQPHEAFQTFSRKVFANGALTTKTKQLIAVAVAMSRSAPTASAVTPKQRCERARPARN